MATFIFGFGSLISAESRKRTGESGAAYACIVQGLERSWSHRVTLPEGPARPNPAIAGVSAVSVHAREGSTTNGVVVKVEESELPKYDEREIGYDRIPVDVAHVALCSEESVADVLGRTQKFGSMWARRRRSPQQISPSSNLTSTSSCSAAK